MDKTSQRRIDELSHKIMLNAESFLRAANARCTEWFPGRNVRVVVSQGRRSELYQFGLWTIGRTFDRNTGVWVTDESKIVTRALPSQSKHCRGEAFDIAFIENGKVMMKMDPEAPENKKIWMEAASLAETFGLKAGARWSKPDYPHFEV